MCLDGQGAGDVVWADRYQVCECVLILNTAVWAAGDLYGGNLQETN